MLSLVQWLREVAVYIFGQWAVLEAVGGLVVLGQRIHLHLVRLSSKPVIESSMFPPSFALEEVIDLLEAHPRGHFFLLNAVGHPLHESVARMRLHIH